MSAKCFFDTNVLVYAAIGKGPVVRIAIKKAERYGISYWDAAILAAAEVHGADIVYSEDFNDGQISAASE